MSPPRASVNLSKLRHKLFGPTLDDSVLYGVDRVMDFFTVSPRNEIEPRLSDSANEETFYESCESFPLDATAIQPPPPVSKFTVPKLSHKEMEFFRGAIAQLPRTSQRRLAREVPDDGKAPELLRCRWAVARVNVFDDGSETYEIMKTADEKRLAAMVVPVDTEIVFAMFKNGYTGSYRVCYQRRRT